jgi:hypothetical protein
MRDVEIAPFMFKLFQEKSYVIGRLLTSKSYSVVKINPNPHTVYCINHITLDELFKKS